MLAVSGIVASSLLLLACWKDFSPRGLRRAVERTYPAEAAAYLEQTVNPAAIYNQLNWGGYLIWRLPAFPVTIDGRTNLHGDERIDRSEKTWSGRSEPGADPEFLTARIIVADRTTALAEILRVDPCFEAIHEDALAVIFRPRVTKNDPSRRDRRHSEPDLRLTLAQRQFNIDHMITGKSPVELPAKLELKPADGRRRSLQSPPTTPGNLQERAGRSISAKSRRPNR